MPHTPFFFALAILATMLLFDVSILFHELGHAIVIRLLLGKGSVQEIRAGYGTFLRWGNLRLGILPIWGYVRFRDEDVTGPDWRLIFVAGPAASILTGYLFLALGEQTLWSLPKNWVSVMRIMGTANFAIAALNMVPIPPLDGWKIVESFLPLIGIRLTKEARARIYKWGMIVITVVSFGFVALHGFYSGGN